MDENRIGGIVLCGGKSSRMGKPKAWLLIDGEPLLVRTVRELSEVVSPVIVAAAAGQELPPLPGDVRILHDDVPDRGPLGGLAAALAVLETENAFVASCDLPGLTSNIVKQIIEFWKENCDAAVPRIAGKPQPLAAAYRTNLLPIIQQHLAMKRLSLRDLLAAISVQWLDDLDATCFANVNTPEDWQRYREAQR